MQSRPKRALALGALLGASVLLGSTGPGVHAALPVGGSTEPRVGATAKPEKLFEVDALTPFSRGWKTRSVSSALERFDGFTWPVKAAINTPFGGDHNGVDIEGETGDPIAAAAPGKIVFAGDDGDGYGTKVVIKHERGLSTLYSHLNTIKISKGVVDQGDIIGTVGCTGSCTGDHLHFEILEKETPVNPLGYLP
ncbi:MAG: M23 family metallopeptidase [Actinomycetota bacterium]|nr:M23 family metallopeptidase [Actinomycetota bacterium]